MQHFKKLGEVPHSFAALHVTIRTRAGTRRNHLADAMGYYGLPQYMRTPQLELQCAVCLHADGHPVFQHTYSAVVESWGSDWEEVRAQALRPGAWHRDTAVWDMPNGVWIDFGVPCSIEVDDAGRVLELMGIDKEELVNAIRRTYAPVNNLLK